MFLERSGENAHRILHTIEGPQGITAAFRTFGERSMPAVVMVHGWMQAGNCWRKQIAVLAQSHSVVTIDLPGHGRSGSLTGDHVTSPLLCPQSLRAVLKYLDLHESPIVLGGWSFGGGVINLYRHMCGVEHVASIITFGTSIGSMRVEDVDSDVFTETMNMNDSRLPAPVRLASLPSFQRLLTYEPPTEDEYDETYGYNRTSLEKSWKVDGSEVMPVLGGQGVEREVREAKIPFLIVQGKHDALVPVAVAYAFQEAVPHAHLLLLDCGHSAFLEEAEQVNKVLLNILDALSA